MEMDQESQTIQEFLMKKKIKLFNYKKKSIILKKDLENQLLVRSSQKTKFIDFLNRLKLRIKLFILRMKLFQEKFLQAIY